MEEIEAEVSDGKRDVFATYVCTTVDRGIPHPGDISEPASLSAVPLPPSNYPLWDALPSELVEGGKLSQLQLEGVLYACTKHLEWLPSGERAGFFIGDGAGVGKGRQLSGIIIDNYARGRRRHVWVSTSTDLYMDACRDIKDLGCHLQVINNCQMLDKESRALGLSKDFKEGVLFLTYSTLTSTLKGKTRLQQVIDWVGGPEEFDGCLIFDECHKAKNFTLGKEAGSTKVASCVIDLQRRLPRARVVYASATGVSEVGNMAYMSRLGLWGPGSGFESFESFLDSMRRRGMSFMEMLAIEMKAEGNYVARGLSFREAEFAELACVLTPEQVAQYDAAVSFWANLRAGLGRAIARTGSGKESFKAYWAAQQRFFKLLCVSAKIPTVVAEAKRAIDNGFSVVVGLQSTGEAATDSLGLTPGERCGWVSTLRAMLEAFIKGHFPTLYNHQAPGEVQPEAWQQDDAQCISERQRLLDRLGQLQLPFNFLDELIESLGGPDAVAEMTGRKGRIVRRRGSGVVYELRAKADSGDMDSLNIAERDAFLKGRKVVAIVSDAASTGISLHASHTCANQRRRLHQTIELPWSADKAIQQLGRTHRSNQVCAPLYQLVTTNLGGEKRFAAAVARRLQSLGALTRGDRQAASGVDLSASNFDSPLGRKALRVMYDMIVQDSSSLPPGVRLAQLLEGCDDPEEVSHILPLPASGTVSAADLPGLCRTMHSNLRQHVALMGVGRAGSGGGPGRPTADTVAEDPFQVMVPLPEGQGAGGGGGGGSSSAKDLGDVRRFLNRILGLPVASQNFLFNYFAATLEAEVQAARVEGRFVDGVSDLPGKDIIRECPRTLLWSDPLTGASCYRNAITLDRGMSFEAACAKLEHEQRGDKVDSRMGFRLSRRPIFGHTHAILALPNKGGLRPGMYAIHRPSTGLSPFEMDASELNSKYAPADREEVRPVWDEAFERSACECMHGPSCTGGAACQIGRRRLRVCVLSGSVVKVWAVLESILERNAAVVTRPERAMRVVRVTFASDGTHVVGVRYPAALLPEVVVTLQSQELLMQSGAMAAGVAAAAAAAAAGPSPAALWSPQGGARVRREAPTPVDAKSKAKAFRAPRTVMDFFKPRQRQQQLAGAQVAGAALVVAAAAAAKPAAAAAKPATAAAKPATVAAAEASPNPAAAPAAAVPKHTAQARPAAAASPTTCAVDLTGDEGAEEERGMDPSAASTREQQQQPAAKRARWGTAAAGRQQASKAVATAAVTAVVTDASAVQDITNAPCLRAAGPPAAAGNGMSGGGPQQQEPGQQLDALLGMGFPHAEATRALKMCGGDVQQAALWLASNC